MQCTDNFVGSHWCPCIENERINKTPEMAFHAPTNTRKRVMSIFASRVTRDAQKIQSSDWPK